MRSAYPHPGSQRARQLRSRTTHTPSGTPGTRQSLTRSSLGERHHSCVFLGPGRAEITLHPVGESSRWTANVLGKGAGFCPRSSWAGFNRWEMSWMDGTGGTSYEGTSLGIIRKRSKNTKLEEIEETREPK